MFKLIDISIMHILFNYGSAPLSQKVQKSHGTVGLITQYFRHWDARKSETQGGEKLMQNRTKETKRGWWWQDALPSSSFSHFHPGIICLLSIEGKFEKNQGNLGVCDLVMVQTELLEP